MGTRAEKQGTSFQINQNRISNKDAVEERIEWSCLPIIQRSLDGIIDEPAVLFAHRQVEINPQPAAVRHNRFATDGIHCGFLEVFPIQPNATFLPSGNVIKIKTVLKQEFILLSNRQTSECAACLSG